MTQLAPKKPLNGSLRHRINKYAHLQGQRHENDLRVMLYAQVQQARDAGAEYEALAAMVSKFESAQ
jgi:hypothetical protein